MAKNVYCNNCSKVIAQGHVNDGKIFIECRHCGVRNVIGVEPAARVISIEERTIQRLSNQK